jgi:hypothetical protein
MYILRTLDTLVTRKLSIDGDVTDIAGSEDSTYFAGDGKLAIFAILNSPQGVAIDVTGNIYIADSVNSCIRKISVGGLITTIAGHDTVHGDSSNGTVATDAFIGRPLSIAVGSTGIYFTDFWDTLFDPKHHRIRVIR